MGISVKLELKKRKVCEEIEDVISSMNGFYYQKSGVPCDVLILETDENFRFELIHSFQASAIFLTSERVDPNFLIQVLRAGVKEFFPQPIKKEEVRSALLRFKEQKEQMRGTEKRRGRIINVIGSKGGVGTTTIAVNLASNLAGLGKQVALVDMNLLFGEVPIFLNLESAYNWGEIVKNISRLDSTYLMTILSKHASGLYVLPSPGESSGLHISEASSDIDKLLAFIQSMFDFVVIDGGHSLYDTSLKGLEVANTVYLVTELSLPYLTNVNKLLWKFRQLGYPKEDDTKVIVNRYHRNSLIQPKDAEQSIKKRIHWCIPNDYLVVTSAINQGKPIAEVERDAEISKSFKDLALETIGKRTK